MRIGVVSVILVAGVCAPGPVSTAQEAGPEATAEIVRLDAVVTDDQGQLVRDLQASDFQLLEDGKVQTLTQFLAVRGLGPQGKVAPQVGVMPTPTAPAAGGPGRYVVILVDDLHIARDNFEFAREALRRFVDEFLGPDDRVAIVTSAGPGGVWELTQDRAALGAAIQDLTFRQAAVAPARGSQMTPAQAEMILRGDPSALHLATRLMLDEPGSVLSGQTPQAAVEAAGGYTPASIIDNREKAAAHEARRQARAILAEELHFSQITLILVDDVLRSLAELPGRKLCLLVSDGFLVGTGTSDEQTRHLRAVIDAATRSGAVVYALDAHGLTTTGGDSATAGAPAPPGLRERVERLSRQEFRETLSALANDTGGFLVRGTNELASGLGRMLEDNDAYYLMAYEPTNSKHDGRFRRIEVRVPGRADLKVRTRAGYFAPDDRKRASTREGGLTLPVALSDAEARAALGAALPASGIPVSLTVDYLDLPPGGPQAVVRARMEVADLPWREAEGRRRADLDIVGGVFDVSGALVGRPFTRHVALDLTPAEQERVQQSGLQFQQRVLAAPGRHDVRLVVLDASLAPLGGASEQIEIPDLAAQELTLSSVFLSSTTASSTTAPEGVAPDDAGTPETLRDAQVLRRFKRSESLYFQVYVYNVVPDESDVVLQAQIRSSGNLVAASKAQPMTFHEKDGVPLPQSNGMSLEGFDPGRYELRVVVVDRRTGATAFRDVDFTVE
jgi:VWFA-related protein